jgi:uncharacterized RDD family membrane protein YckC
VLTVGCLLQPGELAEMPTRHRDHSLGEGVFFAPEEYAGVGRRILIVLVDSMVIVCATIALAVLLFLASDYIGERTCFYCWVLHLILVWAYLTVIKTSRIRTVGYWVAGTKIIDLNGKRPSLVRMTFRLMLWIFGPFSFFFDLIWVGVDPDRQTLRDRFAGTCVVANRAEPLGRGEIHLAYFNAGGFAISYPHVTHRNPHSN